jgi:putative ABC transport system ATP-binding protein
MDSVLLTEGLSKTYSAEGIDVQALHGVDLAVEAGEFVSIMGPSGCGKSTLLHLLGGLDRPSDGAVWLNGERVDGLSEKAWALLRRREIGFVFQFFNLIGNLTVADNVELPALLGGMPARQARARREELLSELGIADVAGTVPGRISGGQQQRVALARALVNEPAVLLADEPTGNLDTRTSVEVMEIFQRLRVERGITIILITHEHQIAEYGSRMISFRDGHVVSDIQNDNWRVASLELAELPVASA